MVALHELVEYDDVHGNGHGQPSTSREAMRPNALRDQQGHGHSRVGALTFRGERARAAIGKYRPALYPPRADVDDETGQDPERTLNHGERLT